MGSVEILAAVVTTAVGLLARTTALPTAPIR
jgi:hypothetical protein